MAFTSSFDPSWLTQTGPFNIEGADEFSQFNIPQQYEFSWDNVPWIESPYNIYQEASQQPIYTPEGGLADNSNAFPGANLNIARYRFDPYKGYMQYQDKSGNTGYLMGTGGQLDSGISMSPNMPNNGLARWLGPNPNEEYRQLGYDPYGAMGRQYSPYKIREDVGQGWFSKNMDWLVPAAIGGLGGGLAASGVGMGSGATGAAAGGATGLASLPTAGTWAQTALPALGATAGEWTLPAALSGAVTPLAGATTGISETLADMFKNFGLDNNFNIPGTGGGAGSVPAEGATMFDEIFGPPLDLANPGINPLSEFMGPGIDLANPGINPLNEFMGPPADLAGSSGFGLKDIWNWMNSPLAQGGKSALQLATKLGSAAVGDQASKRSNQQLQQYLQQQQAAADPFGPQRPFYQDELKKSYIDPLELYNSPEYQSLKQMFEEGIRRRDAAKGRRVANEFPRAIELQDHFMKWLGDYRQGLQNPAGTTISPNNVGQLGQLFQSGLNNRYNALGNYTNALGSIFDPYANQKQQMTDKLTAFLNALG